MLLPNDSFCNGPIPVASWESPGDGIFEFMTVFESFLAGGLIFRLLLPLPSSSGAVCNFYPAVRTGSSNTLFFFRGFLPRRQDGV